MRAGIIGCGYLGWRIARKLLSSREIPLVVTRSTEKAATLRAAGIDVALGDVGRGPVEALGSVDGLIIALGFDRTAREGPAELRLRVLEHLAASLPRARRVIYVSTTGVYGAASGRLDERSEARPVRAGAVAHWEAEERLRTGPWQGVTTCLRLGGLYGPGRLPEAARLRAAEPIERDGDHWLNLIHVDDAARVVSAQWDAAPERACLVVTDGGAVMRKVFYGEMARVHGWPAPRFAPQLDAARRADTPARRTVRSRWFAQDVAPHIEFADYREGLRDIARRIG